MPIQIDPISDHLDSIAALARAQFDLWGPLTSRNTLEEYQELLQLAAKSDQLPITLVAVDGSKVLGSVNLLNNDLPLRLDLAPWLAQLFVFPEYRNQGVGASLVKAVSVEARKLGWHNLYLYTSGTLPDFYERLGWSRIEEIEYQGKPRVVMIYRFDSKGVS